MRIDLTPAEAANDTGSLRLSGGGFNQTLAIAGSFVGNDDTVDVQFQNVPIHASYSLTYVGGDGQETTVVTSTAFQSLQDDSLPPEDTSPSN